jgi:hypothetical protein
MYTFQFSRTYHEVERCFLTPNFALFGVGPRSMSISPRSCCIKHGKTRAQPRYGGGGWVSVRAVFRRPMEENISTGKATGKGTGRERWKKIT